MSTKVPDPEVLSRGKVQLLAEDHPSYRSTLDMVLRFGMELADESTWHRWFQFRHVELWQAVALQLHMDPDRGPWEKLSILLLEEDRLTPQHLFCDRLRQAMLYIKRGSLPIVEAGDRPSRAKVHLWNFATWCDDIGLPCPVQMPRHDPKPAKLAKAPAATPAPQPPGVPSDYLRAKDLEPLLPFSVSTLWRHVKEGRFPRPVPLSRGVTAWRRDDYEAWKAQNSPAPAAKKAGKHR